MAQFFAVKSIYKNFGKLAALSDISFSVNQGELVGLIGPNGAGKTTLFNVITGFYRATSGQVLFKDKDVSQARPNELAEMGMVRTFQIPRPFKELTVQDNVAVGTLFNPERMHKTHLSPEEFVGKILEGVKLSPYKDQLAGNLGYGNLKLLEVGRAQGPLPELLLLDEPFAGLSLNEIESISEILRGLTAKGLTLVIVEHKLRELMKLVKRVIVLHYGKKIADGNPEEISRDEQVLKAYLGRRWSKPNA
ncbi:MAG: ABC transporter ATP-binding protein [Deltaproteobacteria bacterium]|jgi:branched-chain amino acid transport system ATP-binding protein|nr:ABC transporter ATP-binding protein [Deltaproteobacteria bacterium]